MCCTTTVLSTLTQQLKQMRGHIINILLFITIDINENFGSRSVEPINCATKRIVVFPHYLMVDNVEVFPHGPLELLLI